MQLHLVQPTGKNKPRSHMRRALKALARWPMLQGNDLTWDNTRNAKFPFLFARTLVMFC